ncbi:anaerobic sulfite reductase subunit AsrA [Clostridium luticellarii]|uniref:Anaerobic sulfite reductase subunit A n=1 Tax=Clostridium luticellarii TaxID=1691940 RepID=A0A2T0BMQ8_9CLOT|nr:anaerobic sulfite reductase subunit AsrA [Clostridium luticellarii]PRR85159.1 Anaerobic sulfite reductase subunit A [Clostridium luticellarii]
MRTPKTYRLKAEDMDKLFAELEQKYIIYAPVRIQGGGRYAKQDSILYKPVHKYEEIEYKERSTYPMKEVLTPITQTLFYFTEDEYRESKMKEKKDILVFGRACDINSIKIQDQIYLKNGDTEDYFYKRKRGRIKFALMECTEQFEGCFCCSVGANITDLHSIAVSFGRNAYVEVLDEDFDVYFENCQLSDYKIKFPEENELKVDYPIIENIDMANKLKKHSMWDEFDDRCIACGSCTMACSTCTCFETTDIVYLQNAQVGERRRTCSSCMLDEFDRVAGGHSFRNRTSEKYRYKILHKVYGYNARFNTGPMCVGCGRCSARCPELISYPATLNKLSRAIEEIKQEEGIDNAK